MFVLAKDEALSPKVARLEVALIMTLVCYLRLGGGVSVERDVKSKYRGVTSGDCGRTNGGWDVAVAGQEAYGA